MIDFGKKSVLGIRIDAIDYEAAVAKVMDAAQKRQAMAVSALAVHGVMTGVLDRTHKYRLNEMDLVVPDGQPVRWAIQWLHGRRLPDRVYGPELMLRTCERAAADGLPIYLYGSSADVIAALEVNLQRHLPRLIIAGSRPSLFRTTSRAERAKIVEEIEASGARLTFVGLGCPRQETWTYEYRSLISMPLLAVGAAFDFHAGRLAQAPPSMQRWGLEWLFRLASEPRRLWKRYLLLNPMYLSLLALEMTRVRRFDPGDVIAPVEDALFG